jgi:hypothetical protein
MNRLQWTGQEGFNEAEFVDFKVKGEVAGKYKTYGNLSVRDVTASRKDLLRGMVEWQRTVLLTRCSCSRSTERDRAGVADAQLVDRRQGVVRVRRVTNVSAEHLWC